MQKNVRIFVATVVCIAIAAVCALAYAQPGLNVRAVIGTVVFATMGTIANSIARTTKKNYGASIAFLPFLTSVVLYPSWVTAVLVGVAVAIGELRQQKSGIKRAFNIAQYSLAISVSTALYTSLGGVSLLDSPRFVWLPHSTAVVSFLVLNTLLVATAVALSTERAVVDVWVKNVRGTIAYDVVAIPFVYWLALFYVKLGWAGVLFGFVSLAGVRQLYSKNRLLELAYEETLEILVGAVELRDPYTSGHSQRVRKYSQIIASALELPAKQIERIGVAALLHDVGKIDGMFVEILQKPGKLTPDERAIMELHPLKSAELVSRASQLADIVDTVRHHHENWDGTGYPSQLAGRDIPLGSRIIMFADTIDAMTTDRPYRKALGPAEVRAELQKHRGSQFDPTICDVLMESPEFLRIFDSNDSGKVQSLTQIFDRVKRRSRTPAVA